MARITDIFLVDTPDQDAVVMRSKASAAEIPAIIGDSFVKLDEYLGGKGVMPADTPFVRIVGSDPKALEVSAGMAVSEAVPGDGAIEAFRIPAGEKIVCYWQGVNDEMGHLYEEMHSFAKRLDCDVREGFYEYYLNGPEFGEDALLTKVMMVLE